MEERGKIKQEKGRRNLKIRKNGTKNIKEAKQH